MPPPMQPKHSISDPAHSIDGRLLLRPLIGSGADPDQ